MATNRDDGVRGPGGGSTVGAPASAPAPNRGMPLRLSVLLVIAFVAGAVGGALAYVSARGDPADADAVEAATLFAGPIAIPDEVRMPDIELTVPLYNGGPGGLDVVALGLDHWHLTSTPDPVRITPGTWENVVVTARPECSAVAPSATVDVTVRAGAHERTLSIDSLYGGELSDVGLRMCRPDAPFLGHPVLWTDEVAVIGQDDDTLHVRLRVLPESTGNAELSGTVAEADGLGALISAPPRASEPPESPEPSELRAFDVRWAVRDCTRVNELDWSELQLRDEDSVVVEIWSPRLVAMLARFAATQCGDRS